MGAAGAVRLGVHAAGGIAIAEGIGIGRVAVGALAGGVIANG